MKFFLALLLFSIHSYANIDLRYGVQGRSFPGIGGEAYLESGYNYALWGDTNTNFFGLIRPSLQVRSNLVINTVGGQLSFYPISFIGLEAGFTNIYSNWDDFVMYDCKTQRCKGEIHRNYTAAKIALGYKDFLAIHRAEYNKNKYNDPKGKDEQVVEFLFGTLVAPNKDNHIFNLSFLGYKLGDDVVGIVHEYAKFETSNMKYHSTYAIYNKKINEESYILGLGTIYSDHWGHGFVINFAYNKNILKSLRLF